MGVNGSSVESSPVQVTMSGGIQGSNYGGHAPIANAKAFLLQVGTSGYGSEATSLLTSAAGHADTTIVGPNQPATAWQPAGTAYYTTTDTAGDFNITGDYTCTAGLPVYLYVVGGAPDTSPSTAYSYLKSATGNGSTLTFVVDEEKMYVGQQVLFAGIPAGNPFASLNGTTQTVTAISANDNTGFSISSSLSGSSSAFGNIATATPQGVQNPAIVNVAVLGNCPSSAPYNFSSGSSAINFVYVNEVSTVAAMYALAPFAETSTKSGTVVTRTGTDAQHIGIPAGNALALTGIQNAAVNAGQLYDITGASNNVSAADGEAHIARSYVPNSVAGGSYASVPQNLIDTLGNILAACVDSANTKGTGAPGGGGSYSPQCNTLFSTATADGTTSGTQPTDTATAAINIAHYPAGENNASFISSLYGLPSGVVPFVPALTALPNDFMIGINITDNNGGGVFLGTAAKPNGLAADANGNVFVTTTGCNVGCTIGLPPTQLASGMISYTAGGTGVAVDPNGKVWVVNGSQAANGGNGPSGAFYTSSVPISTNSFTGYGTYNSTFGKAVTGSTTVSIAIDGNGVAYVADSAETYIHKISALGTAPAFTQYLMTGQVGVVSGQQNCELDNVNIAVDNKSAGYNIWTVNTAGTLTQGICTVANTASTVATSATTPVNTANVLSQIGPIYNSGLIGLAIDNNGNSWVTEDSAGNVTAAEFAATFGDDKYNENYGFVSSGGLTGDVAVAVDGNDNAWYVNNTANSLTEYKILGPANAGSVGSAISPSTGYTAGGTLSAPTQIAIDPSGDVWVANSGTLGSVGYSVTELIGVAAPTYAPLSSATLNNKLGAKP